MTSEWNKPKPARRLPNGECCEGYLPFSSGAHKVATAIVVVAVSSSIGSIHSSGIKFYWLNLLL